MTRKIAILLNWIFKQVQYLNRSIPRTKNGLDNDESCCSSSPRPLQDHIWTCATCSDKVKHLLEDIWWSILITYSRVSILITYMYIWIYSSVGILITYSVGRITSFCRMLKKRERWLKKFVGNFDIKSSAITLCALFLFDKIKICYYHMQVWSKSLAYQPGFILCFGGGVLLSTIFIHMLKEVVHQHNCSQHDHDQCHHRHLHVWSHVILVFIYSAIFHRSTPCSSLRWNKCGKTTARISPPCTSVTFMPDI